MNRSCRRKMQLEHRLPGNVRRVQTTLLTLMVLHARLVLWVVNVMADRVLMLEQGGGVPESFQRCFLLVRCIVHVCLEIKRPQTHVPKAMKVQCVVSAQMATEVMAAHAFLATDQHPCYFLPSVYLGSQPFSHIFSCSLRSTATIMPVYYLLSSLSFNHLVYCETTTSHFQMVLIAWRR